MMLFTLGGFFKSIISLFKTRVLSDGGNFEAENNLENQLNKLGSDLFNSASLVITPNTYKENLLFAVKPDKVGTNLLQWSEGFDNAAWNKLALTVSANTTISPTGNQDADTLIADGTNNTHRVASSNFSVTTGLTYTISVYAKKNTNNFLQIYGIGFPNSFFANFNLDNGTIGTVGITTTATITDVGNGWYRCTATGQQTATGNAQAAFNIINSTTSGRGDGNTLTTSVFLWGAQAEQSSTATEYISTTDRAIINGTIGDLIVNRATTATRVNEQGLIETVPYNLVTYSEELENAQWSKYNITVVQNSIISPNGDMTGDKLIEGTNDGLKYMISSSFSPGTVGNIHTASIYLKANTRTWAYLTFGWDGSGDRAAYFNLIDGVVGNLEGGVTASIMSIGNGWYRCTITGTMLNNAPRLSISMATGNGTRSYLGDGVSSIYAWGAQLVNGTEPKPYQLTTNRLNVPRIDYTTGSPAILVEPQRTNLLKWSEEFNNGYWNKINVTIIKNATTAPNGNLSASKIIATATDANHILYNGAVSFVSSQSYTFSYYAKSAEYTKTAIRIGGPGYSIVNRAEINLSNGTIIYQQGFTSLQVQAVGNGWYRIQGTFVSASGLSANIQPLSNSYSVVSDNYTFLGDGTSGIFVWGAQLEEGSNATSYIPTTTSSVTRNADVISKSGISNLIGQTEGSIFCEFERTTETANFKHLLTLYGDTQLTNNLWLVNYGGVTDLILQIVINSTAYQRYISLLIGKNKLAVIYDTTGCDIFINGTKLTRLALPSFPSLYNLELHYGTARQYGSGYLFSFWKTKLTDEQAIKLTTL